MKDILIYDGECGICSALAVWAQKNSDGNIEIIPYQNFDFDSSEIDLQVAEKSAVFFSGKRNKFYKNARSIFETLKIIRLPYKILGYVFGNTFFSILFYPLYRAVAKYRRWISVKLGYNACKIG